MVYQKNNASRFGVTFKVMCRKVQRFNMTEECDSIGFFISKFRKIGEYKTNVLNIC